MLFFFCSYIRNVGSFLCSKLSLLLIPLHEAASTVIKHEQIFLQGGGVLQISVLQ